MSEVVIGNGGLEGCGVAGGLWGGWRVVGWLGSSGEARRSCSEAAQLRGGGVCDVKRQLELKWLPLDWYKYM